jgi:hypothetical protein
MMKFLWGLIFWDLVSFATSFYFSPVFRKVILCFLCSICLIYFQSFLLHVRPRDRASIETPPTYTKSAGNRNFMENIEVFLKLIKTRECHVTNDLFNFSELYNDESNTTELLL